MSHPILMNNRPTFKHNEQQCHREISKQCWRSSGNKTPYHHSEVPHLLDQQKDLLKQFCCLCSVQQHSISHLSTAKQSGLTQILLNYTSSQAKVLLLPFVSRKKNSASVITDFKTEVTHRSLCSPKRFCE